jgi:hypothetical protein
MWKSDRDCKRAEIAINPTSMSRRGENLRPFQFRKGGPPGPGRPPGSRSKLNELALALLSADFAKHGAQVIEQVRRKKPEAYLSGVLSLLPRQSQVERYNAFNELSDAELEQLESLLAALRADTVREIDADVAEPVNGTDDAIAVPGKNVEIDDRPQVSFFDNSPEPSKR